jgi:hypothetical protein
MINNKRKNSKANRSARRNLEENNGMITAQSYSLRTNLSQAFTGTKEESNNSRHDGVKYMDVQKINLQKKKILL